MSIEIRNITKSFGDYKALNDVTLTVPAGELVALLGPSGSGKTTLLRVIAGLEIPDNGEIIFNGGSDSSGQRDVRDQQVGFVFQHYALFKHMTVFENVAFGLKVRPKKERPSKEEIKNKVYELLKLVQLESAANRYPSQLSGGQRQRIALARALAVEPKVLLLDEPFGALDAKVRQELRRWLRRLHDELHVTSVFVTHDQEEALEVADRIVVMNEGRIEQMGTPNEVYDSPATPFVYRFIGNVNIFHGRASHGEARMGNIVLEAPDHKDAGNAAVVGYARPHEIEVEKYHKGGEGIEAIINHIYPFGPLVRLELKRGENGELMEAEISKERFSELGLKAGELVSVSIRNMRVFLEDYTI